jgi:hypothetical protein
MYGDEYGAVMERSARESEVLGKSFPNTTSSATNPTSFNMDSLYAFNIIF